MTIEQVTAPSQSGIRASLAWLDASIQRRPNLCMYSLLAAGFLVRLWHAFTFIVFLPSSIDLSTEVRQYALLLAFAMGSAYFLERALQANSALAMLASGGFLWLAILSHFSAFLFAGVLAVYAILRMVE